MCQSDKNHPKTFMSLSIFVASKDLRWLDVVTSTSAGEKARWDSQHMVVFKILQPQVENSSRINISSQSCVNCEGFCWSNQLKTFGEFENLRNLGFSSRNTRRSSDLSSCFSVEQDCRVFWTVEEFIMRLPTIVPRQYGDNLRFKSTTS